MGAQATNAINALTSLKAVFTTIESGVSTGVPEIDAQTRKLLTDLKLGQHAATLLDGGSRAAQNATSATQTTASGIPRVQEADYTHVQNFLTAIDTQIAVLNNPTATARRSHKTLQ